MSQSQETKIAVMESRMASIEKKLDELICSFSDFRKEYKDDQITQELKTEERFSETERRFTQLDDKFSAKWVEKAIIWAGTVVGSIIIGALIYSILK